MMSAFATITLLLAAVGVNGVVAYSVALRRREIGIRRAFGATAGSVVRLFAGRAIRLIGLGLLLGFPMAWRASRLGAMLVLRCE
jgi:ABC-type antimicrobial peptide transport system permease subunit